MRKQICAVMIAVALFIKGGVAVAAPVTAAKALEHVRSFMSRTGMRKAKGERQASLAFTIDRRVENENRCMLYAFRIEGGGWVIASGDDIAHPILAYGEDEVSDTIPSNMRVWLENYADEIAWGQKVGWRSAAASVEPKVQIDNLVPVGWHQNSPYNKNCKFGTTTCVTGCVATAMAQIMYYWGCVGRSGQTFRHGCTALDGYTTTTKKYKVDALEALESFDWDNMSTNENNAVAWLMRYCGQSVEMDYTSDSSGAFTELVPDALKNNFGYDSGARLVDRGYMTSTQWIDMIYSELSEGRPVIIDGDGQQGGHAFICTGYQASTQKFYINWGWNLYNGWYEMSALTPDPKKISQYGSFNSNVRAVVGIQPPTGNTEFQDFDMLNVVGIQLTGPRVLSRQARAYDGEGKVSLTIAALPGYVRYYETDDDWDSFNCDVACGVYDEGGRLIKVVGEENLTFYNGVGCLDFSLTLGAEWPYGTYTIVPLCRLDRGDDWRPMYHGDTFYVKAEVEDKTITLTPSVDIKVTSFTSKKSGTKYVNTISFTNMGCEQLCGTYYVFVAGSLDKEVELTTMPGASGTITLKKTTQIKNTNLVTLCRDYNQRLVYWANQPATANALVSYEVWMDNYTANRDMVGDSIKARLRISNYGGVAYQHEVKASLKDGYYMEKDVQTQQVNIPPYSEQTLEFNFTDFSYDRSYKVTYDFPHFLWGEIYDEVEGESYYIYKGVAVAGPDGTRLYRDYQVSWMDVPDDAIFVDARYSSNTAELPAGGNTNTLYVLPEGATIPETLAGLNVVTGNNAENITLDDNYPFVSPVGFTAGEISYTRTFTNGHHGNGSGGWSTISLPFAVEKEDVTADMTPTSWFASTDDEGRKFWLYGFKSDDGQVVTFSYVDAMEAYTPYIIAVPDNTWGSKYDLRNKMFTFTGHNAHIKANECKAVTDRGGKYDMIGRSFAAQRSNLYLLNEEGSNFVYTIGNIETTPFRAYFAGYYDNGGGQAGAVKFRFDTQSATPVKSPYITTYAGAEAVYTLEGVKCPEGMALPKGIYIKNGKKMVVK